MFLKNLRDKREHGSLAILIFMLYGFILYILDISGTINLTNFPVLNFVCGLTVITVTFALSLKCAMRKDCNIRQFDTALIGTVMSVYVFIGMVFGK